jgi:hypothetical protein
MTEDHQGQDGRLWDTPLRKKLKKRHDQYIPKEKGLSGVKATKTPSERRSELFRKKFNKRAGIEQQPPEPPSDCRGCADQCSYDHNLKLCPKSSIVVRCGQCGQKVRIRLILGQEWKYCPVCAEMKR